MNQTISAPNPTKIQPMKTLVKSCCLLGAVLLGLNAETLRAQSFVTCGAISTNVGAQLKFVNGANYASNSGFVQFLTYERFTNHFTGVGGSYCYTSDTLISNSPLTLVFQALSTKTNPAAAAFGSYIACKILSVTGPVGGVLSFWESSAGWPTYTFPVGGVYDPNKNWFEVGNIENGAGTPGGDPFGNIPGRRFTVNQAGEYMVTFQLYDISKTHPTDLNSPIHVPSDPLTIKFATKVDIATTGFAQTNGVVTMTFKQGGLTNLFVETASDLSGNWIPVAGPFTNAPVTTNSVQILTTLKFTNNPSVAKIFYRLHGATP